MALGPTLGVENIAGPPLNGAPTEDAGRAEIFGFLPGNSGIRGTTHVHTAALAAAGTVAIGPFAKGSSVELEVAVDDGTEPSELIYYRQTTTNTDVPVADGTSPFWTLFSNACKQFHLLGNQQYITLLNPSAENLIVSSKRLV